MSDLNSLEEEFRRNIFVKPDCPPADALLAWRRGALPDDLRSGIALHVSTCEQCEMLLADVTPLPDLALTAEQRRRIERHVLGQSKGRTAWKYFWIVGTGAIAAMLAVAVHRSVRPVPTAPQTASTVSTPSAVAMHVDVAKLEEPNDLEAAHFSFRGTGPSEPSRRDVAKAFQAYNADNYTVAIQEFSSLRQRYPRSAVIPLYIGVSQLLLDRNDAALISLRDAALYARGNRSQDVAWYRALAMFKNGDPGAKQGFDNICRGPNTRHTKQSCDIATSLSH